MQPLQSDLALGSKESLVAAQSAQLERAQAASDRGDPAKAAKMFEEVLATMMVRELRRGVEGGFFGSGAGADVYEGWLDQHVGKALADTGALDLAQSIRLSIRDKQAEAQATAGNEVEQ
jgi:Rod binding domain-containing protein